MSTAGKRKQPTVTLPTPPPEKPPRLLGESKATTAALGHLEKGIKLIYQKEFKKARQEFESLIENYPGEPEIQARARSYIQICEREEASHRRPTITQDQLYALGVMEHNRENYEGAIAHFRQALAERPEADYIYYSIAASHALSNHLSEGVQDLKKAIELNEDNRVYAKNDPDFAPLHHQKEFTDLVGLSPVAHEPTQT